MALLGAAAVATVKHSSIVPTASMTYGARRSRGTRQTAETSPHWEG